MLKQTSKIKRSLLKVPKYVKRTEFAEVLYFDMHIFSIGKWSQIRNRGCWGSPLPLCLTGRKKKKKRQKVCKTRVSFTTHNLFACVSSLVVRFHYLKTNQSETIFLVKWCVCEKQTFMAVQSCLKKKKKKKKIIPMYYYALLLQCSIPFQKFSHMENTELILQRLIFNIALIFPSVLHTESIIYCFALCL